MNRVRFSHMNCAAAQALDLVGDWWTLLIVREAFYGTRRFGEFQVNLGIAKNILASRLDALVAAGILVKQAEPGSPHEGYGLTDQGEDLLPALVALMQWGDKWVFGRGKEPLKLLDSQDRKAIQPMALTAHDGRPLTVSELRFKPGPGADETTLGRFAKPRR